MSKIVVANCFQETNSFHPNSTTYEHFNVHFGQDLFEADRQDISGALNVFSRQTNIELVPAYGAGMGAGGTITQACFDQIAEECLEAIEKHSTNAEALYFSMHGAMAAEEEKDPEGYLLEETRKILGPNVPIVISLDMHGTVTRRMLQNINGAAILHTYPHIDWYQLGKRAAGMLLRILEGVKPIIASVFTRRPWCVVTN